MILRLGRSGGMEPKSKTRALSILAAGGVAATALATGIVGGSGSGPDEAAAAALEPFSSCEELLEYARDHRWSREAATLYREGDVILNAGAETTAVSADALAESAPTEDSGAVGPSETGTNTQEAGIDEPDIAKLSGTTLFRVHGRTLTSYDVSGDEAVVLDELELELKRGADSPQLLISGERAIVISTGYENDGETTAVTELDISDPSAISALRRLDLEGAHVSTRLQGSTARLVLESQPDYPGLGDGTPEPQPLPQDGSEPPTGATGETGPEPDPEDLRPDWLPQASLSDFDTGERTESALLGCDDVAYPDEFSGLGLLSVLTIDLSEGILPTDLDAVMTDGTTVYGSGTSLYVATSKITQPDGGLTSAIGRFIAPDSTSVPVEPPTETAIHRFATSESETTEYAASGEVRGTLIGQFAMSEEDGVLRVASTQGSSFVDGPGESVSMITTLTEGDGDLEEMGRVGGLGPGEDIYAVRFIGDMGYVVTFEQTDPLYTVDLSDPADPETTGELKIPGYSAYLHPVADGRLLGIGQAGTSDGTITGAQASLFDVADPTSPERLDALDLSDGSYGSTSTEWDHHAFLYAPEEALAIVPVQSYGRKNFRGAVAMSVDPESGLTEVARMEDGFGQIERMFVAGENLVTVSRGGVTVWALTDL